MNKKDKRKFTAAFKVKVAMAALKGQSTIAQIVKSYDLHPTGPPGGWGNELAGAAKDGGA